MALGHHVRRVPSQVKIYMATVGATQLQCKMRGRPDKAVARSGAVFTMCGISYYPMPSRNLFLIIQGRPKIKVDREVVLEAVGLQLQLPTQLRLLLSKAVVVWTGMPIPSTPYSVILAAVIMSHRFSVCDSM